MNARFISVLALLVLSLTILVACDDELTTEEPLPAPPSDFEWSRTWHDVNLIGKPVFDRIDNGIALPVRGAFDIVKVSADGDELWRQAYDWDYFSSGGGYYPGFIATGRTLFGEEQFLEYVAYNGVPEDRLILDTNLPHTIMMARAPNLAFAFGQTGNAELRGRITGRMLSIQPLEVTHEYVYDHDGDFHDYADGAAPTSDGGSVLLVFRRPLEQIPFSWPALMRFSSDGSLQWTYEHTFSNRDAFNDVIVLGNGNAIAVGCSECDSLNSHSQIICLDPSGALLWVREWDYLQDYESAVSAVETTDGILVAGNTWIDPETEAPFLLLYSLEGELLASRLLEGDVVDYKGGLSVDFSHNVYVCQSLERGLGNSLSKLRQPIFPDL